MNEVQILVAGDVFWWMEGGEQQESLEGLLERQQKRGRP